MATYLQGVTDYIPDYQPFQPDLNFYANLLQAKQTQYDSNWSQLNNLYGQLYGADLTHDLNIKKKDELLKQIDFNLKRVSGLDLSLEQNVNQALQVFRPFYEDKYLMKDMAWTKNFKNTYNAANALKNSQDEKQRKQWWSTGMQALDIRKQMFKESTLDETLNMANATYTPFVNTITEYLDLAKKYDIGKVEQLPDQSGMYLVRKKNGDLILPTLQNLFAAEFSNRPDIQDMYREAAFVERMNYAYQNKEKFGSTLEAEKDYIKQKYDWLKTYAANNNAKAQDEVNTAKNLQGAVEKDIKDGNVNPQQENYGKSLNDLFLVNEAVANQAENLNNQINDQQATSVVKGYEEDILADMELARLKIDAGFAQVAAEQDIINAANTYAFSNSEIEYKVNTIGLENLRHQNAFERQQAAHQDKLEEIQAQSDAKMYEKAVDNLVERKIWAFDENGKLVKNPQANGFGINLKEIADAGATTEGLYTFDQLQQMTKDELIDQNATQPVNNLMTYIQYAVDNPSGSLLTAAQLAQFVKNFHSTNPTALRILKEGSKNNMADIKKVWDGIYKQYQSDPEGFIRKYTGSGQMYNVNTLFKSWASQNTGQTLAQNYLKDDQMIKLEQLQRSHIALRDIENANYKRIKNKFTTDLNYVIKNVKEKSPEVYKNITQDKIDQAIELMMRRYSLDGNGHLEEFKKIAPQVDAEISSILGFSIGKKTTGPSEASWYNYVFPLTNIFRGDTETVEDKASWVSDVFDQSFEELTNLETDEGGLLPYFAETARKGGSGNKYALASETGVMAVAPGVYWDPGNDASRNMFRTILSTNWNQNIEQFRITTQGNILPEDLKGDSGIEQTEALAIVRELQSQLNTNDKLSPFFIGATRISMENSDLGSMKLNAPREVIEQVIKGMAGEDVSEMDVKNKIDKIYQNGITFIAPKNIWENNKLFSDQYPNPTEVVLKSSSINYNDPLGNGKYTIKRNKATGDYNGVGEYYEMLPDGNKKTHYSYFDVTSRAGKEIADRELQFNNLIINAQILNLDTYRRIHQSGDQEAISRANANFGKMTSQSFWNYNN